VRAHALATAIALTLPLGTAGVAAAKLPGVLTQDPHHPFVVRPASIGYTGDGTGLVGGTDGTSVRHPGHLRWTAYNSRQGIGRGVVWLDDCDPSCADGHFSAFPVAVHVFAPKKGHFTRLTLQFTYNGKHVTDRRGVRHYAGSDGYPSYWEYYIISTNAG
jgi:hypothetical protein